MDILFRSAGVDLTTTACQKAISDWGGEVKDITHTVAVTCTNQGSPGYDLLVNGKLGLPASVDRTLLQGVGCAGGLAIMRVAAQVAQGATSRGHAAKILCYACELCTPSIGSELDFVAGCTDTAEVSIAGALFSDAAAAFVMCNRLGMNHGVEPKFEVLDWATAVIPNSIDQLGYYARSTGKSLTSLLKRPRAKEWTGYRTILTRQVPIRAVDAIRPMFEGLLRSVQKITGDADLDASDFDWALHPGGQAIIDGAEREMKLVQDQLRATREIYKTRGNSSSPSVLIVMDRLKYMGTGRPFVVATAFGPGMTIEMNMLRRCQEVHR
jgi:type III polyketide synthase